MTQAAEARLTDIQKAKRQDDEDRKAREIALLRKDLDDTFGTAHGRRVLRYLKDICGYQKSSVVADPQNGDPLGSGTIYNAARQNVYLTIRKYVNREIKIAVEIDESDSGSSDLFS